MFLGKKEVKCYEVGVNYFEAIGHQEGVFFDITDSGIILRIYFCGVTAHEAGQFRLQSWPAQDHQKAVPALSGSGLNGHCMGHPSSLIPRT